MAHKLLLADDSVTIQKVVELTFSEEDFTIVATGDGNSAYERIRSDRPDVILSDVNMPGMNGYDLCAKVKQDPALSGIPFLFLRGTFESFDEARASSVGADGFIVKPFESQELINRVKELVQAPRAAAEPVLAESAGQPFPPVAAPEFIQPAYVEAPPEPVFFEPEPPAAATKTPAKPPRIPQAVEASAPTAPPAEEDLWSEVPASRFAPVEPVEITRPGEAAFDFAQADEEATAPVSVPQEPETATIPGVESFELTRHRRDEPVFAVSAPLPPPPAPVAPVPVAAAPATQAMSEEALARLVAASVRESLDRILPGIVREVVQQAAMEVLWEVVPETAERLITREINRITGASPEG